MTEKVTRSHFDISNDDQTQGEKEGKEWLPSVFIDPGILARMHGTGIPASGGAARSPHGRPICVSVYDEIPSLVRQFPALGDVFNHYRRNHEKRIKDLQISSAEKERLLYGILAMKKQSNRKRKGR
ncbi:MAG: hypothetical protein HY508_15690 [Acidobacteria bacterium]|nr:hypothetical protein [Acidobacteriota bacterium]